MKKTLIALLLTAAIGLGAIQQQHIAVLVKKRGGAGVDLVNEGFGGIGIPAGWVFSGGGSGDPDYVADAIVGTQSLFLNNTPGQSASYIYQFADQSGEVWAFCRFRPGVIGSGGDTFYLLNPAGDTVVVGLYVGGSGQIKITANGSESAASAMTITTSDRPYVWLHWTPSGTCEVFLSLDGTKPSTDDATHAYLTKTGATSAAGFVVLYNNYNGGYVYDHVIVRTTSIGANP